MTRSRRDGESGMTLVELIVVMVVSLVVLMLGFTIVNSTDKAAANIGAEGINADDARAVVTALDANLRYSANVWLCSWTSSTTSCTSASGASSPAAPTCSSTVSICPSSSTSVTALVSESLSGTCTYWNLSTASGNYLTSTVGATTTNVMPGVTAASSTGFTLPSTVSGLVQLDFSVDSAAIHGSNVATGSSALASSANAVSVHQLLAPNNLAAASAASLAQCSA